MMLTAKTTDGKVIRRYLPGILTPDELVEEQRDLDRRADQLSPQPPSREFQRELEEDRA